jgi:hypothetical protein
MKRFLMIVGLALTLVGCKTVYIDRIDLQPLLNILHESWSPGDSAYSAGSPIQLRYYPQNTKVKAASVVFLQRTN